MITPPRSICILFAVFALTACETLEKADNAFLKRNPQTLIDQGATRLDAAQAKAHVSGNTEFWSQGTVFYDPDGQLKLVWHKIKSTGSWVIAEDGNICFSVPTWKDTRCHYYLDLDGTVTIVLKDKTHGVSKVEQGDKSLR